MYILKLKPACKNNIWGGNTLIQHFNKSSSQPTLAETWELSNHKDGSSIIDNGPYKGMSFRDYLEISEKKIWGKHCQKDTFFPIMIKFIDAKDPLSIQVHPDNSYALQHEGELGKNEFWYVLDAKPHAFLYYGVNQEISKKDFHKYIQNGTICHYLKKIPVKKGDCFFIKTGTIHAIGAGIVVAEIQQCSNSTYRIYDFQRKDANGQYRELHIQKAMDVACLTPTKELSIRPIEKKTPNYTKKILIDNSFFSSSKYSIHKEYTSSASLDTFQVLTILDGQATLSWENQTIFIQKGDCLFIPADEKSYTIIGEIEFLKTWISDKHLQSL